MTVLVYGRTEYAEPLVEVGTAEELEDVRDAYEGAWVELVAFPENAAHWIVRDGEDVEDE
jgi:hypothetical protein